MGGSQAKKRMGLRNHRKGDPLRHTPLCTLVTEGPDDAILPRKLSNPVLESPSRRELHHELLLSHRRGLVLEEKPELQRVLEQRRRGQEQTLGPPSDLEQELRKRKQKLYELEHEEVNRRENPAVIPEFVRVRENLRHIQVLAQ